LKTCILPYVQPDVASGAVYLFIFHPARFWRVAVRLATCNLAVLGLQGIAWTVSTIQAFVCTEYLAVGSVRFTRR
jgi:hypothetical protein